MHLLTKITLIHYQAEKFSTHPGMELLQEYSEGKLVTKKHSENNKKIINFTKYSGDFSSWWASNLIPFPVTKVKLQ